jgi:hypothetical protein
MPLSEPLRLPANESGTRFVYDAEKMILVAADERMTCRTPSPVHGERVADSRRLVHREPHQGAQPWHANENPGSVFYAVPASGGMVP